jgi:hypothetical protein
MRPHSVAILAVLLRILLENAGQNKFDVDLNVKNGSKIVSSKKYELYVDKREPNYIKITIGKMWTCEVEVFRKEINKNKFYIKHNHGYSEEHFEIHSNSINGKYEGHSQFSYFESRTVNPRDLKIEATYLNLVYEVERIA